MSVQKNKFHGNVSLGIGIIFLILMFGLTILEQIWLPYSPESVDMSQTCLSPSLEHWFGTDQLGRDLFSRIVSGAKYSLVIGFGGVGFAALIGTTIGMVSGFYGGRISTFLMRLMDIMLSIPSILLAITFVAAFGKGLVNTILAVGIVAIPDYARLVRGMALSIKEQDYVQAGRMIGCSDIRLLLFYIFPGMVPTLVVRCTLGVATAILEGASLGFLGLGVQPPLAEWGDMLGKSKNYIFQAPHTLLFPGLALTILILAVNMLGDGLNETIKKHR